MADRRYYEPDGFDEGDFNYLTEDDAIARFLERRSGGDDGQSEAASRSEINSRLDYYASDYRRYSSYEPDRIRRAAAENRTVSVNGAGAMPRRAAEQTGGAHSTRPAGHKSGRSNAGIIAKAVCVLLVASAALFAGYYGIVGLLTSGINRVEIDTAYSVQGADEVADIAVMTSNRYVKNVLLLGIDDDGGEGSRSDTIMIASVDTRSRTVKLCSILRDNYVSIPGHSKSRINAAFAYGGAQLALQTVEANYRLHIDSYVSIDMAALINVVDAVGGVTIEITDAEAKQINRYSYSDSTVEEGVQRLDGKQAVCYARIRKIDSDFGRTSRQRTLINAIVKRCRDLSVGELVNLVKTVSPYLTTNLSSAQIATLALQVLPALRNEMEQLSLPTEGTYEDRTVNGMAVLVPDLASDVQILHEFLYGTD